MLCLGRLLTEDMSENTPKNRKMLKYNIKEESNSLCK